MFLNKKDLKFKNTQRAKRGWESLEQVDASCCPAPLLPSPPRSPSGYLCQGCPRLAVRG